MSEDRTTTQAPLSEVKLDYIKAPTFKDVFVDGVFGGITPRGYIQMAVYNERFAIPQTVVFKVQEDGSPGDEVEHKRVARSDVVRDLEANLIMDADLARSIGTWLVEKADALDAAQKQRGKVKDNSEESQKKVN